MARLAFTLADRAALQSSFARLRWDNPQP